MEHLDIKVDLPLTEFVNDYAEGWLTPVEYEAFTEYLATNPSIGLFAEKSRIGKKMLSSTYKVSAAADFEAKLAERIAEEKQTESQTI